MFGLQAFLDSYGPLALAGVAAAMAAGGFAKGVVGFALPLIGLGVAAAFVPYAVAVAALVLPMLVSNLFQTLRQGVGPAVATARRFWRLNLALVTMIFIAAQLVVALPDRLLFGVVGVIVSAFGLSQLAGSNPRFHPEGRGAVEAAIGAVAGFLGGLSGIWGPPIVMYLIATGLPKVELVRAQSLSFLLGSAVLLAAHLHSGVLNPVTLPVSAWMVVPTMLAMVVGYRVHDRLDQGRFRQATLVVLVLTGLNLLRRALF